MKFRAISRTVEPATPVLTTAEAKTHLRVDHSDEDSYIDALIAANTQFIEEFTGRALITQTWVARYTQWPQYNRGFKYFQLPRGNVQSVTTLKYYDSTETLTTLDASSYTLENLAPALIVLKGSFANPSLSDNRLAAVEATFVAGYGDASTDVPALLVQALRLMVKHSYEIRMPILENVNATKVPMSAMTILKLFKLRSL